MIGAGVVTLLGISIEEGAVVVGAVVNRGVTKNTIVAGIPARYIKDVS